MEDVKNESVFLALWAASVLIGWRPLVDTLTLSARNDEYTYILLVLPISVALILIERQSLRKLKDWDFRFAPALVGVSIAIAIWIGFFLHSLPSDVRLSCDMFALVLAWVGIFLLAFGAKAAQSANFPLLFLFGLVPLTQAGLRAVIAALQAGSSWSAHALFSMFGVPVLQNGNLLTIPNLTIQIAQECSSIRSSSMLLLTSAVLAQLFLKSRWRKTLVIATAVPLSVAKNGLRIFTIAMLGTRADPAYLTGRLHHEGGILFFLAALAGLLAVLLLCRRGDTRLSAI
jgi:exosortase